MKKLLSLFLCLCMAFSCALCALAAPSPYLTDLPTIYVHGSGSALYIPQPDGSKKQIYPIKLPADFMEKQVKGNLDVFAKAFFTQQWDEFCVVLHDVIVPLFDDLRLDENGNAPNGSVVDWRPKLNPATVGGKYAFDQFPFLFDFRMDPFKTADVLHDYIEKVLAVTGAEKVNLVGRCLGASITSAYMQKYDGQYIASNLIYSAAMNGATQCSKCFCGEIYLQSDGIERYVYDLKLFADETLNTLLQSFVTLLNKTYGLDILSWAVNNVYKDIYMQIVPPILSETFGTYPGYWSMVNDRDYEKAKATVFHDDPEKWKNFIDIIDNYHYNVQVKAPELFRHFQEKGITMACIAKYGFQSIPVDKDSDLLSDGMCSVEDATYGATTSGLMDTLSKEYLAAAEANGTMRFISPDKQIDASTCLFPERTWFIKNLSHKAFPVCVEALMAKIVNDGGMTVFSDEAFPQYLVYDQESKTISPQMSDLPQTSAPSQTSDNSDTTKRYRVSYFTALKRFWKAVFTLIRNAIESKRSIA